MLVGTGWARCRGRGPPTIRPDRARAGARPRVDRAMACARLSVLQPTGCRSSGHAAALVVAVVVREVAGERLDELVLVDFGTVAGLVLRSYRPDAPLSRRCGLSAVLARACSPRAV